MFSRSAPRSFSWTNVLHRLRAGVLDLLFFCLLEVTLELLLLQIVVQLVLPGVSRHHLVLVNQVTLTAESQMELLDLDHVFGECHDNKLFPRLVLAELAFHIDNITLMKNILGMVGCLTSLLKCFDSS